MIEDIVYDPAIMALDGVVISGLGDVIIPVQHFHLLPWDQVDMRDSNKSTLSAGGSPLRDCDWTICLWVKDSKGETHPMVKQYRWCIPQGLVGLMDWCRDCAEESIRQQFRKLIRCRP